MTQPENPPAFPKMNDRAWLESAVNFIRTRGLAQDFIDYCGGWKCPLLAERAKDGAK
jgi:hypothetical protein